jgi:hypothetical protein
MKKSFLINTPRNPEVSRITHLESIKELDKTRHGELARIDQMKLVNSGNYMDFETNHKLKGFSGNLLIKPHIIHR